jgi:quercetin dioxygenase-like cupin family protein
MSTTTSAHTRIAAHSGESLHVLGDLIHVKVTAEQTGGAFSMFEIVAPPGDGPPLHRHAPCEAFHILDGTLIIRGADDSETLAAPGDTVFVAPDAPHSYRNPGPGNARFLVTLAPGGFEAFFTDLGDPAGDVTEPKPLTGPPDIGHVLAVTGRHGIEILEGPPPGP